METSLVTLFRHALEEEGGPMQPSAAARQAGISTRTVFRFLAAGKVLTPCGFVPFARDAGGNVSLVRLGCIKALRAALPRPGRKFGTRYRKYRGANAGQRILSTAKKKDNRWRLQRILAMLEQMDDKEQLQIIRTLAAQKYHRL